MALLTTFAIISGVTLVVGATAVGVGYYETEDDRIRDKIKQIDQEVENCDTIINCFTDLKTKIQNGKDYLNASKSDFTNGGHVLDGVPLANDEFNSCISKIDNAITNVNNIIKRYNDDKSSLKKIRKKLKSKLN